MRMEKKYQGELIAPPPVVVHEKPIKYPNKTIGNRLELYRRSLGMRSYEFAKHLNISQGSYSDLKNENSFPSCQTIINIINLGECNIVWLLTGKKGKVIIILHIN